MRVRGRSVLPKPGGDKRLRGAAEIWSTRMPHALSSHSGMQNRFLFRSHQPRSCSEKT
jgi:hypothetical protein